MLNTRTTIRVAALAGALSLLSAPAFAQGGPPPSGPNPAVIAAQAKPTPASPWGPPDLSGSWIVPNRMFPPAPAAIDPTGKKEICILGCGIGEGPAIGVRTIAPTPAAFLASEVERPNRPKYKPEFLPKVRELEATQVTTDTTLKCGNPGLPRIGAPDKIVQTKDQLVFIYEDLSGSFWRIVQLDKAKYNPTYERGPMGQSMGRWEGDTLVVDTDRLSDDTWLVDDGAFHTEGLKVTERFRRVGDSVQYEVIADDSVLAEPWKQTFSLVLGEDPYQPVACLDQTTDLVVDATHHNNPR